MIDLVLKVPIKNGMCLLSWKHYNCLWNVSGDKSSTDWDKAWSNFKKQGRKTLFSQFSPDKYVSWNPRRSEFPLSEEVDPIKRTERSNLKFWNSPTFTLGGAIIIVLFLLLYTILAPIKWYPLFILNQLNYRIRSEMLSHRKCKLSTNVIDWWLLHTLAWFLRNYPFSSVFS